MRKNNAFNLCDSMHCNDQIDVLLIPGNNEGCYIEIVINDTTIESYRYNYYDANDPIIKYIYKEMKRKADNGIYPNINKIEVDI